MKLNEYKQINEQVYSGKLPNGLSVFVVPKPGFHKKFALFATDYGGIDRRFKIAGNWHDTPAGVAHFLEHKMFDTESDNVMEQFSLNGASPNAYTSTDLTAYYFECTDKFYENLELLLSFVSVPYFTPESVKKEQGIIAQEILMTEDDPDYCLYYGLLKSLFKSNPLRDSIAGTVESISAITADTLYDCHKIFYAPSNMALCVVGDVDPCKIFDKAAEILPEGVGENPVRDYGVPETLLPLTSTFSSAMDVSLPIFLAGCKIDPGSDDENVLWREIVSAVALEVLCGHSSPLYFRLYAEGSVNSDFYASFDSAAGAAYVLFGGEARDPQYVFNEVLNEVKTFALHGPDKALFERTKKAAIGSHIRALNSFNAIASSIVEGYFRNFDPFDAPKMLTQITIDDIKEFVRKNLVPENMAISVINPVK